MRLFVMLNRPKKCWGKVYSTGRVSTDFANRNVFDYYIPYKYESPDITPKEKKNLEIYQSALDRESIIDLLSRYLVVHKRMNVERDQRIYLLSDYANMLHGFPEYALVLAVFHFLEEDENIWFPTCGEIKKRAKSYVIEYPEQLEGKEKL